MRFRKPFALSAAISAATLLAACSATNPIETPLSRASHFDRHGHQIVGFLAPNVGIRGLHLALSASPPKRVMMKKPKGGLFGSSFYGYDSTTGYLPGGIFEYTNPNSANDPPACSISLWYVNGFGVDTMGNTMVPSYTDISGDNGGIRVYAGPYTCGNLTAFIPDAAGQAADAYSQNVTSGGNIIVGEIEHYTTGNQGNGPGAVMVCKVAGTSGTCGSPLENTAEATPYCYTTGTQEQCDYPVIAGVALDRKGNCYASGYTGTSYPWTPALFYWHGCTGNALVASGYSVQSFGGIAIDSVGNVVTDDFDASADAGNLYVYTCKYKKASKIVPASFTCTGDSKTALKGASLFFNIGKDGHLVAGDFGNGQVDVYTYASTGSTYDYSFDNGLTDSQDVMGGAESPQLR